MQCPVCGPLLTYPIDLPTFAACCRIGAGSKHLSMKRDPEYRAFVWRSALRAVVYFGLIVSAYFLYQYLMPEDWKAILAPISDRPKLVFLIYTLSETFFGIIPPEFFVIWATKFPLHTYGWIIAALAVLSFVGALINFYVGRQLHEGRVYQFLIKGRLKKWVGYYHRFGGIIILISAVTPLPFAAISLISGTLGFRFHRYLYFASARFLRFLFYGFFFWGIN